jgi:hypothetical protein
MPAVNQAGYSNEHIELFYVLIRISKPVSICFIKMKNGRTTGALSSLSLEHTQMTFFEILIIPSYPPSALPYNRCTSVVPFLLLQNACRKPGLE